MTAEIVVGIVTVSDRAFHGVYPDESGPAIEAWCAHNMPTARITSRVIVPDDLDAIQTAVKSATDGVSPPDMLLTTGGTGFTERDVTPEAIGPLLHRHAPGLVVAIMTESMKITPLAMLSRPVAGTRNKTLVVTLPGKPKACKENLDILRVALPHLFNLMRAKPDLHHKTGCQCGHNHGDGKNHNDESLSLPIDDVVNRPRQSPFSMLSVAEASTIVSRFATRLQTDHINVDSDDLVGRVLAKAVYAHHNVPNTRVSLVDGYAVLASDGAGLFQVTDSVVAGSDSALPMLLPGHAARVTTGAPIPANATAVVMVEDTELVETTANKQEERTVKILRAIQQHANIRNAGSDIRQGQLVLPAGTVISSQNAHLGIILSSGNTMPRVAIISTGNELLPGGPGELRAGQVVDTNQPCLKSLLSPYAHVLDVGVIPDRADAIEEAIVQACREADVVITTGGVSMGEKDYIKPVLTQMGAQIHFGRVNMKPGKPTTFATMSDEDTVKLFYGLPGNPVSALVTCHLFVVPALKNMSGRSDFDHKTIKVQLGHDVELDAVRPEYCRVKIEMKQEADGSIKLLAHTTGQQRSSTLLSMHDADALALLPSSSEFGAAAIPKGALVDAIMLRNIFA